MKKWNLIIDVEKCEDCNNCFLSCKDEHVDNDFPGYSLSQPLHGHRWMNIMRKERGQFPLIDVAYLPVPCMHCDNAPCINAGKNGAVYKRDDGIVIIDPEKAKGQRDIVKACPYDAIWWNEESSIAQKCTFCSHLLDDGWKEPRCVQACPTGSLQVLYLEDAAMMNIIESEKLEVYLPKLRTNPRVYYKNLYRYNSNFLAGSIAVEVDEKIECAENAKVILYKDSIKIDETVTDNYGDFKIDHLNEKSGRYMLEIVYPDYTKKTLEIDLENSISVGTIIL